MQKLRKLTFLRASIHHSPQVETILTFLDREKGWAEAEALSSEDDVTGFGVWGLPTTRSGTDGDSTAGPCTPGEHPEHSPAGLLQALHDGGLRKFQLLCLSESHLML